MTLNVTKCPKDILLRLTALPMAMSFMFGSLSRDLMAETPMTLWPSPIRRASRVWQCFQG